MPFTVSQPIFVSVPNTVKENSCILKWEECCVVLVKMKELSPLHSISLLIIAKNSRNNAQCCWVFWKVNDGREVREVSQNLSSNWYSSDLLFCFVLFFLFLALTCGGAEVQWTPILKKLQEKSFLSSLRTETENLLWAVGMKGHPPPPPPTPQFFSPDPTFRPALFAILHGCSSGGIGAGTKICSDRAHFLCKGTRKEVPGV